MKELHPLTSGWNKEKWISHAGYAAQAGHCLFLIQAPLGSGVVQQEQSVEGSSPCCRAQAQDESLNQPSCGPPGHPKRLDHMPCFSFTHAMNPGMQDALRALQNTNESIAKADNSEICFRSALLIQTKLLPGKARELPNYRAQLSDLLAR